METLERSWFPVAWSRDLRRTPRRVTLLDRQFVAFRTRRGAPAVLENRCPHRGVELATGRVDDGGIRCRYHGWRYDTGPYHLVGHSFGGYVALELAQRLVRSGEQVGLLGILDTAAPLPGRAPLGPDWDSAVWIETVGRMFERLLGRPIDLSAADLAGLDDRSQVDALRARLAERDLLPPEVDAEQFAGFVRTYRADQQCVYTPKEPYDGRLVFFRAAQLHPDSVPPPELAWTLDDPTRAWDRFAAEVEVHEIPGDHLSSLTPPHVQTLAALLGALLMRGAGAAADRARSTMGR